MRERDTIQHALDPSETESSPSAPRYDAVDAAMDELDSATEAVEAAAEPDFGDAAPPAWFRARRRTEPESADHTRDAPQRPTPGTRTKRRRKKKDVLLVVEEPPSEEVGAWRRLWRWAWSDEARGYYASILLHVSVLVALLSIVLPPNRHEIGGINAILSQDDGVAEEELLGQDTVEMQVESPQAADQTPPERTNVTNFLEPVSRGAGSGQTDFQFRMPAGGNAVTKGSFTAWTDPEDPQPGRPYRIVIQIQLPADIRQYPVSDLSGKVVGTDEYEQELPVDPDKPFNTTTLRAGKPVQAKLTDRLRVFDNTVQLMILIPGAKELVKDTIHVSSKLLNERQSLEIEF